MRIANGCTRRATAGSVEVGLPRSRLAALQVVEYFRAFLVGRVGWSRGLAADHLRARSGCSGARSSRRSAATAPTRSARTWSSSCACTATCATTASRTGSRSCPTRSAGPRRRRTRHALAPAPPLAARPRRDAVAAPADGVQPALRALGLLAVPYFLVFELLGPVIEVVGYLFSRSRPPRAALAAVPDRVPHDRRPARRAAVGLGARARGVLLPPPPAAATRDPARLRGGRELRLPAAEQPVADDRVRRPRPRQPRAWGAQVRKGFNTSP